MRARADAQGIGGGLLDTRAVLPLYTLVPRTDQEIERLIGTVRVVLFALAGDVLCAEFRPVHTCGNLQVLSN